MTHKQASHCFSTATEWTLAQCWRRSQVHNKISRLAKVIKVVGMKPMRTRRSFGSCLIVTTKHLLSLGFVGKTNHHLHTPSHQKNEDSNTMIVRQTVTLIVHQSPLVVHLTLVPHLLLLSQSGIRNNQPPNFCHSFQHCQLFKWWTDQADVAGHCCWTKVNNCFLQPFMMDWWEFFVTGQQPKKLSNVT